VIAGGEPGQRVLFLSPILTGGLLIELVCARTAPSALLAESAPQEPRVPDGELIHA
jgi:hypothetical protein